MFDFSFILSVHLADNQLVYLKKKVRMLEQEKTSETTEGTFTNLNRPNNAFDRSEVLDLLQALLHLASTQANQKAKEYAAGLDKTLARWDSLSSPDLQRQERFNHIQHPRPGTPYGQGPCYKCGDTEDTGVCFTLMLVLKWFLMITV